MKTQNPHTRRWTTARTTRLGLAIVAPMAATKAAPVSPAVTAARQINPTTVEIVLTEEKRLTLDFYGGGVQNGRYSHKGHQIAIENQNGWTDGGVASPNPFYWSKQGYGILWHTFKPGTYDFGAATKGEVRISHEADYLDIFVMVDATPAALLRDFYQLTGDPVLLPKFGFYQGTSMPTTGTSGKRTRRESCLKTANATRKARRTRAASRSPSTGKKQPSIFRPSGDRSLP